MDDKLPECLKAVIWTEEFAAAQRAKHEGAAATAAPEAPSASAPSSEPTDEPMRPTAAAP
jgi:hypothetical protein